MPGLLEVPITTEPRKLLPPASIRLGWPLTFPGRVERGLGPACSLPVMLTEQGLGRMGRPPPCLPV